MLAAFTADQRGWAMRNVLACALVALSCLALSRFAVAPADADEWPARPVKIVAPFAPGGTSDALARVLAGHFSEIYRQSFYIENHPGAGGMLGAAAVAAAEPDGYTLVLSGIASHVIAP